MAFCSRAWRHELGVRREGLETGAEHRAAPAGHPEASQAARALAPQHPCVRHDRLGVPVQPGLERARRARRCRPRRGARHAARARRAHGDPPRAPSPVDLPAEVEQDVRHPRVPGETVGRHHLQSVEGEIVRRPEPTSRTPTRASSRSGPTSCPCGSRSCASTVPSGCGSTWTRAMVTRHARWPGSSCISWLPSSCRRRVVPCGSTSSTGSPVTRVTGSRTGSNPRARAVRASTRKATLSIHWRLSPTKRRCASRRARSPTA